MDSESKANRPIDIDLMKKSKNMVYSNFFAKSDIVKEWVNDKQVFQTLWRGKISKSSFCLKAPNVYRSELPKILIDRFGIKDKDRFALKYKEAILGDGQEWTRITTLHSSSLAALLCFYNVSESNPLRMSEYTFTESFFEVKTHVFGESESNMDVVLRGTDGDRKKVALFLECKFCEYLNCSKYDGISKEYSEKYNDLGLFGKNKIPNVCFEEDENKICVSPVDKPIYCGGIKQMISHYIGVSNYADYREEALAEHLSFKADENEKVLLGEMLFHFTENFSNANVKLENYQVAYRQLAEIINKKREIMVPYIFIYQDIFDNKNFVVEENIRSFYHFDNL